MDRSDGSMDVCMNEWIVRRIDGRMDLGLNGWMVSISETIPAWA
jgi:hypothetical protein